eukprot:1161846-Pelagomonas_calceolata.AAC.3
MQYLTYSTLAAKSSRLREGSGGGNYKGSALSPKTARTYNEAGSSSKGIDAGISHEVLRHAVFPTYLVDCILLPSLQWLLRLTWGHKAQAPSRSSLTSNWHQSSSLCPHFLAVAVKAVLGSQSSSPIKLILKLT